MSSANMNNVQFCVAPTLFDTAPLLLDTPSGTTLPAVHRLPAHCSLRGHITPQEWYMAANAALGLTDDVATRLFDAFFIVSQPAQQRVETTRAMLFSRTEPSPAGGRTAAQGRTVPLVGFMLFLMAQVFLERPPHHSPGEQSQEHIVAFVKQHLPDMLLLASLGRHGQLTLTEVSELRCLLREFHNGQEHPLGTNLGSLFQQTAGSSAPTVNCTVLAQFIRPRLQLPADVRGAAANITTLVGVAQQTQFVLSAPPIRPHCGLRLQRCQQATIYGLAPLPSTIITGCVNSLVVLGPVGGLLVVDFCSSCQIVAMCAGVVVNNCRNTTVYICTNSAPICVPPIPVPEVAGQQQGNRYQNQGVLFAPYNSFYPTLEEHLSLAAVNPRLNLWDEGLPQHALLPPSRFFPVVVPFPPPSGSESRAYTTRANPCVLPQAYSTALSDRVAKTKRNAEKLQAAYKELNSAGRRDLAESLKRKVNTAFTEWLHESGQAQSVTDLFQPSPATSSGSSGSGSGTSVGGGGASGRTFTVGSR